MPIKNVKKKNDYFVKVCDTHEARPATKVSYPSSTGEKFKKKNSFGATVRLIFS